MATLNDPDTWSQWGKFDEEYVKMTEIKEFRAFPSIALTNLPELRGKWSEEISNDATAMMKAAEASVSFEEIFILLRDGTTSRALVYKPRRKPADGSPLIVLIHGGGFLFGSPEMESPACIHAAESLDCVCVSISYRLAPESKFPTAHEDCWDILQWIASNASKLGADPSRGFILGGTSAGGQLTGALSHWARDRNMQPPLTGIYLNATSMVHQEVIPDQYKGFYSSLKEAEARTGPQKAGQVFHDAVSPDIRSEVWSPLIWQSGHHGLPRTYFQVCGADSQRDDSLIYERILRTEYDIETRVDIYPGMPHVFWFKYTNHTSCEKFYKDTVDGLCWLLRRKI